MSRPEELKEKIAVMEMEVGFLRTVRASPNPKHSIVAGQIELERTEEIKRLRAELDELGIAA